MSTNHPHGAMIIQHTIVTHDPGKWSAVPANNGANGPVWQWGNELLVGFTQGEAFFTGRGHQVDDGQPQHSWLARSLDGGESWQVGAARFGEAGFPYAGGANCQGKEALSLPGAVDFTHPGFVMRVEGHGYHGNAGQHWFYSLDRGVKWMGPYGFGALLDHPELAGRQFTARTAYLVNSASGCFVFLSARSAGIPGQQVSLTDKVFLAQSTDGGLSFQFVAWVAPPTDAARAVMPAPVRLSPERMVAAVRRRHDAFASCWIDCFHTSDHGLSWSFLSRVGETGGSNGNPPALVRLQDGRLCCVYGNRDRAVMLARFSADEGASWGPEQVLRDDFQSKNGSMDLGYARLFQRPDGKLAAVYFWCSPERPETHIAATIFEPSPC